MCRLNARSGIFFLTLALGLCGCTQGVRLDPAKSAALGTLATQASTTPAPALRSEDAVKPPGSRPVPADPVQRAILAALANPARSTSDRAQDQPRQSGAVLRFFRITPGMRVLDLWSGGGYYPELLAYIVGPTGRVVAHNNQFYLSLRAAELEARFVPGRLPNVDRLTGENKALELPYRGFDAVLMTDVYHDICCVDAAGGWLSIDSQKLLAQVFQSLRPGGVLGVVDHRAVPGAPPETGGTLHRIDPALVKRQLSGAGFVFEAESEVLRNPVDDLTKSAFNPAMRGRTDQFVLRFRKPL